VRRWRCRARRWRRNGTAITGATAPSYTTPAVALADDGAVYSVVVSNSQGSVTSNDATLAVGSAITTDEKQKLVRLLGLAFEFASAAFLPFDATTDDGTAFINPASLCQSGSLSVTLGGAPVNPGATVPLTGTLAAVANACDTNGTTYTGSSSIVYNLTSINPDKGSATSTVNNMRVTVSFFDGSNTVVDSDITANGSNGIAVSTTIAGANTISTLTLTPGSDATVRNEQSGGLLATFTGGSLAVTTTEVTASATATRFRLTYNNLSFSVAGVNYVGNGFYEFDFSSFLPVGSGEVVLTGNGVRVGRIFVDSTGQLAIEVDGVVQPFQAPKASSRR
jgi:hypothetical protein